MAISQSRLAKASVREELEGIAKRHARLCAPQTRQSIEERDLIARAEWIYTMAGLGQRIRVSIPFSAWIDQWHVHARA